jgi:hypothetical protein
MKNSITYMIACTVLGGCVLDPDLPADDPADDSIPAGTTLSIEQSEIGGPLIQRVTMNSISFSGALFAEDFYIPVGRRCSEGYVRVDKPGDPVVEWSGNGYCGFQWATPSDPYDCTAVVHAHTNGWWSGGVCTITVHESMVRRYNPAIYEAADTNNATVNTTDLEVVLGAGTRVVIGADGTYAHGDTFLVLSYPMIFPYYGTQAAANDDVAPGILTSRIDFTSPVSGTFTLHAGCYANTTCGATAAWQYVP